jgi:tRNA(Met) cytidine acetyltransferase
VDEAAGIPAPLLSTLLERYPRICFATTVHGYEGTGRGFEVRFREALDRRAPLWRRLPLTTPIRWSPGDPLEALVFRALLLDASPADIPQQQAPTPGAARLVRLDRDALVEDESTLRQVFGLLVLAHYQTRPLDLRMLLDGPNIRVYCLRHGGQVLATLLAAEEGGMASEELRQAIFTGRRRPRGHLLPQTLSAHGGLLEAPALRYLRVVRIAVHPALTRRGLGARLLRGLALEGRQGRFDLVGASFGATPGLIAFWQACGYRPAQMGTSRNAASGEHAIVMLRPLSPAGRRLAARAEGRLERRLGVLLAGPLRRLDPLAAAALARALDPPAPSPCQGCAADCEETEADPGPEIDTFVQGHRTLEAALPLLSDLVRRRLGTALRAGVIGIEDGALMVAAARQLRPVNELIAEAGAPGREALIEKLRALVGRIAHH